MFNGVNGQINTLNLFLLGIISVSFSLKACIPSTIKILLSSNFILFFSSNSCFPSIKFYLGKITSFPFNNSDIFLLN